ncbi:hypothetical protein NGM36_25030 [Streptomyces mutabilis]|uniref:hypothetical protein n=1 Tax=Streptomyces mutabilis TaxID=67332 RepID=UPI0022BA5011|nr:hypothetical protein [Streptomyces mutabilis]MCZ9352995.1 hypothetical protein [Streptomyces mutabilis]
MPYTPPLPGQRITPALLAGLSAPWAPYTATLTGTTIGNGSLVTRYQQAASRIVVAWTLNWGSTTSGNMPVISLPVPPASLGGMRWSGDVTISRGTGAWRAGSAYLADNSNSIATYALTTAAEITSSLTTAGITMQSGGWIQGNIEYEM